MKTKVSRRAVSAALLGSPVLAQAPPPASAPKVQEAPPPVEDLRVAASRNIESTAALLRKFEIPMETEPAFRFKP